MFLEHVNLTVSDLDRSIAFYTELFGYEVRWQGTLTDGRPAAHVGDDRHYIALFQSSADGRSTVDYTAVGMNHVGFVVESIDRVKSTLQALGVEPVAEHDYEPGQRLYFYDPDGIEIELVEYENEPVS